jgi:hypothetical protein
VKSNSDALRQARAAWHELAGRERTTLGRREGTRGGWPPTPSSGGGAEAHGHEAAQQAAYEAFREKPTERHEAIRARQQRSAKAPDEAREHI